jgi:hypothetical protein
VLMWVEASPRAGVIIFIERHHAAPDLSKGEIKGILARASKMLQKDSKRMNDMRSRIRYLPPRNSIHLCDRGLHHLRHPVAGAQAPPQDLSSLAARDTSS